MQREVGWLEEMSTLSSVNQSQPKSGTVQYNAKAKAGGTWKKTTALSEQEPWQAYFLLLVVYYSQPYSAVILSQRLQGI